MIVTTNAFFQLISGEQRSHKSGLNNSSYDYRRDNKRSDHETQKHPLPNKPHFSSSSDATTAPSATKSNSHSSLDEKTRHG